MPIPNQILTGNLAADPERSQTQSGKPRVRFTVIQTARRRSQQTGEWEDGDQSSKRCVAYGDLAQHIAASLSKGRGVLVYGHERDWSSQDQSGQTRYGSEFIVEDIGASLKYATAQVQPTRRADTAQDTTRGQERTFPPAQTEPAGTGGFGGWAQPSDPWSGYGDGFGGTQ